MSFKIRYNSEEYLSKYVREENDVIFNVNPGHTLDAKYMNYIKKYRKNNMIILCIFALWFLIPLGIGIIKLIIELVTGNFESMNIENNHTMSIVMTCFMLVITIVIFMLFLKLFKWAKGRNRIPDVNEILWREGVLTDKLTTVHDHKTKRHLYIDNEDVEPITIVDYKLGNKNDKYIVIYVIRESKFIDSFAIYYDTTESESLLTDRKGVSL